MRTPCEGACWLGTATHGSRRWEGVSYTIMAILLARATCDLYSQPSFVCAPLSDRGTLDDVAQQTEDDIGWVGESHVVSATSQFRRLRALLERGSMLITTGQMAKLADVLPSKSRFYVKEGILQPSRTNIGGYRLLHGNSLLDQLQNIAHLQAAAGLTIGDIKAKIRGAKYYYLGEETHG